MGLAPSFAGMDFLRDVDAALPVLADGGLVLFPADQWWALGCDATNETAAYNLLSTGIQYDHPYLHLMVPEEKDILRFVPQSGLKIFDYLAGASRPAYAIYEQVSGIAPLLLLDDASMAIHTPQSHFCRHLTRRLRKPIMIVAAMLPEAPAPAYFSEVSPELAAVADYTVQYRRNLRLLQRSASVVRWHGDGSISIFSES